MSVTTAHPAPWTVDDLHALPEDGMRHELLDGTLLVNPLPSIGHQLAAARLSTALAAAAGEAYEVLEAVGVLLPAGLLVPDVVVAHAPAVHRGGRELRAADVVAVVEIVSPSSRTQDRSWKPEAYAEAGIATYLRVELDEPAVFAFTLVDARYSEEHVLRGSTSRELHVPFAISLAATDLVGPRA
ncbi:MAG: hypothetical protein JWL64_280 [Frankiales bacterium]|nr:hypothetical protein [Frankiales bacterium]